LIGARPNRPLSRSLTRVLLAVLTVTALISCGQQPSAPSTASPSEAVSPACVKAIREELKGALYRPEAGEVSQLPECKSESEEAIGVAAEQVLREAFGSASTAPSPNP